MHACFYMYMHACFYMYIHACFYMYKCIYHERGPCRPPRSRSLLACIWWHVYVCVHVHVRVFICICMRVFVTVAASLYVASCICMYACARACFYRYMCIYHERGPCRPPQSRSLLACLWCGMYMKTCIYAHAYFHNVLNVYVYIP